MYLVLWTLTGYYLATINAPDSPGRRYVFKPGVERALRFDRLVDAAAARDEIRRAIPDVVVEELPQ